MNIQLSISLLASDRINSLERCLDSIKPLLLKIPSELIVVFTGTDENVKKIAERYTDQIIPFTWCDDFSAARNAGLQKAKGEWFLFIDDDEWFDDVTEICEFFSTGEYLKYNAAHYIQRNYADWSSIQYSDYKAYRMSRIMPDSMFQNSIHEILNPYKGPVKYFSAYVHHYGYLTDTSKQKNIKTLRNIPLLLKEIKANPFYTKNYIQLVKEYMIENEWKKAEAYCREGYLISEKNGETRVSCILRIYLAMILAQNDDKNLAIAEIKKGLKQQKANELEQLLSYEILVNLYKSLKMPDNAVRYGLKYENLISRMDATPELWVKQMIWDWDEQYVKAVSRTLFRRTNCIVCALECHDWKNAEYFLNLLPWEEEYKIQEYYPLFDQWVKQYTIDFRKILNKLPYKSSYLFRQKSLQLFDEKNEKDAKEIFIQSIKIAEDAYQKSQLLKEGLLKNVTLSSLIKKIDLIEWKTYAENAVAEIPLSKISKIQKNIKNMFQKYPLYGIYVEICLLKKELSQSYLNGRAFIDMLKKYCENILCFYKNIYQEFLFAKENMELLPKECRFAYQCIQAIEKYETGEFVECVRFLRKALHCLPEMKGVVWELAHKAENKLKNPEEHSNEEFRQLAVKMKSALHTMIANKQYIEAMSILTKLMPLMPEDLELLKMKQCILQEF